MVSLSQRASLSSVSHTHVFFRLAARHRVHEGMLSGLSPLFNDIDKYYREINVSLYAEEECLRKIRSSFRVTVDDKRRWEYIRDACREASDVLTSEVSSTVFPE